MVFWIISLRDVRELRCAFLRDRWRALEKEHLSLYGSSVRGTWRRGSFTEDPEGYVEEGS
jgi:hypothetical protein